MTTRFKEYLTKFETRQNLYLAIIIFGLGLLFSIIDFQIIKNIRIINYFPLFNLIGYNDNTISIFAIYFWLLTIGLIVTLIVLKCKKKDQKIKENIFFIGGIWLLLLISYLVTMSCTLWAITNISSLSSFGSDNITNVSTFLEYKSLIAYKYIRTYADNSSKEGVAVSLNFVISFIGTATCGILSIMSIQMSKK